MPTINLEALNNDEELELVYSTLATVIARVSASNLMQDEETVKALEKLRELRNAMYDRISW